MWRTHPMWHVVLVALLWVGAAELEGDGTCAAGGCMPTTPTMASGARWHHWPMQKGTPERTGYSPHVMPNISKSEAWTWQAEILDIHRATPLIDDQLNVYVTSIAGRSVKFSPAVEIVVTSCHPLSFLPHSSGAEVWSRKVTQMSDSTTDCLLATQGVVVLSAMDPVVSTLAAGRTQRWNHENNRVLGLSVSDGSVVFKFAPYTTVYNFQASTQHDGSFVFQDVTGAVYRVTLEGKLVWYGGAIDPKSASTAAAVISEGKVCNVGGGMKEGMSEGKGHLHAYDYVTGRKLWWQELPYEGNQAVAVGQLPGAKGLSLVMGMGKNPGIPWFMLVAKILPSWMVPWTYPIYALTLRYPHWFAWPQNRAILAFDAETGDLQPLRLNRFHSECLLCGAACVSVKKDFSVCERCFEMQYEEEKSTVRKAAVFEAPDHIVDNIYLGGESSAIDLDWLREHKVDRVLIVAAYCEAHFPEDLEHAQHR
eukprot:g19831.t1